MAGSRGAASTLRRWTWARPCPGGLPSARPVSARAEATTGLRGGRQTRGQRLPPRSGLVQLAIKPTGADWLIATPVGFFPVPVDVLRRAGRRARWAGRPLLGP